MKIDLYEKSQRRLVGSLLYDNTDITQVLGIVTADDFDNPILEVIFKSIQSLSYKDKQVSAVSVASLLESWGSLEKVGGTSELYLLRDEGRQALLEAPALLYAEEVKKGSTRRNVNIFLEETKPLFVSDGSGVGVFATGHSSWSER